MLAEIADAGEGVKRRKVPEQGGEAGRVVGAVRADGAASPGLLTDADRQRIEGAVTTLEAAKGGIDHRAIRAAIEGLDAASKDFAGRRMNRALEEGLRGRTVGAVEAEVDRSAGDESDLQTRLARSGHSHSGHSH